MQAPGSYQALDMSLPWPSSGSNPQKAAKAVGCLCCPVHYAACAKGPCSKSEHLRACSYWSTSTLVLRQCAHTRLLGGPLKALKKVPVAPAGRRLASAPEPAASAGPGGRSCAGAAPRRCTSRCPGPSCSRSAGSAPARTPRVSASHAIRHTLRGTFPMDRECNAQ